MALFSCFFDEISISIVDISTLFKNIDIDKAFLKNIGIDIDKEFLENIDIDIDKDILENIDIDIDIDKGVIKIPIKQWCKMGAKSDHFCPFSAYLGVFSPVLLMEYRIFISIVDISANLKNIGIDIDIDKEILENIDIDIDIDKDILENIDIDINIDKEILENIDIDIDIVKDSLENIDIVIDIDKEILENIDIDKISNRLEFGISNRAIS